MISARCLDRRAHRLRQPRGLRAADRGSENACPDRREFLRSLCAYTALQMKACDYVMPDFMRIGGVTGWQRSAAIAAAAGIPISTHLYPEVAAHVMRVTETAGCPAGRGRRPRWRAVGLPAPRCGYRHQRRRRTRKQLRGVAPERDHRVHRAPSGRGLPPVARRARRISSSMSRATGSTGSRRWSNAERLTCRSARFSTSQTRKSPTACWMARPANPERSCSRSQTDRGGGNRGCGKVRCPRKGYRRHKAGVRQLCSKIPAA